LHFTVIGLNHRTAPIEVRERITFPDTRLSEALRALGGRPEFSEAAILSTCNRTEIYTVVLHPGHERAVHHFIEDYHGVKAAEYASHVYVHHDAEAVRHLFRVASGLDSLVLGEGQILKQVRDAFAAASDAGTAGKLLNGLFRAAIAAGRRARTETEIGKGGFSVGHAAVDLARSIFGSLDGASILILGAGKMSELTARHLVANGVGLVLVGLGWLVGGGGVGVWVGLLGWWWLWVGLVRWWSVRSSDRGPHPLRIPLARNSMALSEPRYGVPKVMRWRVSCQPPSTSR
jgi:glutamyl-tRNA reductase